MKEHWQREPDGYGYSRWCELYCAWEGRLLPTMRQAHPAGERMFVDYAGQTVDVVDPGTGEVRPAQIFVAVDFPPWSGGVRSERHAAVRMVIRSMLARASAGVR